jgi:DNA-binding IclR family transcriptional regulator
VGPKTMQLLKAMRGQLGDTSASRSVDAVAAAEALGMDTSTHDFDRRLQDLVRAGYLELDPTPRHRPHGGCTGSHLPGWMPRTAISIGR